MEAHAQHFIDTYECKDGVAGMKAQPQSEYHEAEAELDHSGANVLVKDVTFTPDTIFHDRLAKRKLRSKAKEEETVKGKNGKEDEKDEQIEKELTTGPRVFTPILLRPVLFSPGPGAGPDRRSRRSRRRTARAQRSRSRRSSSHHITGNSGIRRGGSWPGGCR